MKDGRELWNHRTLQRKGGLFYTQISAIAGKVAHSCTITEFEERIAAPIHRSLQPSRHALTSNGATLNLNSTILLLLQYFAISCDSRIRKLNDLVAESLSDLLESLLLRLGIVEVYDEPVDSATSYKHVVVVLTDVCEGAWASLSD